MEMLEALWRIAQNYGPGAAVAAAVTLILFHFLFKKFFGKKEQDVATHADIELLLKQLEQTHQELTSMKKQLVRLDWLGQQQWLHGRCVHRNPKPLNGDVAGAGTPNAAQFVMGGPGS